MRSPNWKQSLKQLQMSEELMHHSLEDLKNCDELRESPEWKAIRKAQEDYAKALIALNQKAETVAE